MTDRRRPIWSRLLVVATTLSIVWAPGPTSAAAAPPRADPIPAPAAPGSNPGTPPSWGTGRTEVPGDPRNAAAAPCKAAPGRYLVRFATSSSKSRRAVALSHAKGQTLRAFKLVPGLELIKSTLPAREAVAALRSQSGVVSVEADCIVHLDADPNDPNFDFQWDLRNTGQTGGTVGADIDALGAWAVKTDASAVTVATIDTGMQLDHPDLAMNLWTNPGEVASNGLDDDHNGYVDDIHGWDFVNNDAIPADDNGHGTHVAGTIGAGGSNSIGVTGIAWKVRLMPLKAFDASGSGQVSSIIAALEYAVDNGARISNNSYSGTEFVRAEYDAFVAATSAGHVAFAAAGNDGVNSDEQPHYPASFRLTNVVSVAATNDTDEIAAFSDFGIRTVQVAAPGVSILSTWVGSAYAYLDGTSMATPHVAGVAALIAAQHPTWTGSQIRDRILGTTRHVAGLDGKAWTGGVVDAGAALSGAATVLPPPLPPPTTQALATTVDAAQVPAPAAAPTPPTFADPVPVETGSYDLGPPRIALDPTGKPLIAYTRRFQGVQLLTRSGTGWTDRKLTTAYDDFYWLDLAVNGAGVPIVAVQRAWSDLKTWTDPGVMLVGATSPTATQQRITAACPSYDSCFWDWSPAVAFDAAGHTHVVFSRTEAFDDDMVAAPGGSAPIVSGTGTYYATDRTGTWVVRRLTTDIVDGPAAIAVEADGTVHVVVRRGNGSNSGLAYLTNRTGSWTSLLLTDHAEDFYTSIGVDPAGGVHVVYARPGFGLYYQHRLPAGSWNPPLLIYDGNAVSPDLAMDGGNHVHVAFGITDGQNTAAGIRYATNASGSWVGSAVTGGQGVEPSLAVDSAGHAHVAYFQALGASLGIQYATNTSGSFVSSLARAPSDTGAIAFATDSLGHHHVAFAGHYGEASAGLYYGNDTSGSWVIGRISSTWPANVALALDSGGRAHIAFIGSRVGYATNSSGTWSIQDASPGTDVSQHGIGLALDAAGSPVIVHVNANQSKLLRIRRVGGAWATDTMYSGALIGDPSILIDPSGMLHAAIDARAVGDAALRIIHVRGSTGAWTASSATNGATTRLLPSIGRSSDGTIWIAEWQVGHGIPVHRRDPGTGVWSETLIANGVNDAFPSLVVAADGSLHVTYADGTYYGGSGCNIPECAQGPGLRHAVLTGPTWQTTKLSPRWQDGASALAAGRDGSLSVLFLRTRHGLRMLELIPGKPTATLRLRAASDTGASATDGLTNATVLTWDVTFNRPVTGLTASDFTRTGTATGCVVGAPTGSGAAWAVSLTGCSGGTVGLSLKAGSVTDAKSIAGPLAAVNAANVVIDRTAPTTVAPTATPRAGSLLSGTDLPLIISWSGADGGGSGIARYELARNLNGSATWTSLASTLTTATMNVTAVSSGTLRYATRTVDRAGNVSAWAYGPTMTPLLVQQTSTAVHYTGTWSTATSTSYSGGSTRYATAAGASANYTFTGRSVAWVGSTSTTRGRVKVYVDGVLITTVDLSGATRHRVVIWQKTWSTSASRTLKLVIQGTVGRPRGDLDAVAVLQ